MRTNPRRTEVLLCLLLTACTACLAAAAEKDLRPLLPGKDLPGWPVMAGTYLYAPGQGLTAIYDGGYEAYLKAGVTEAVQELYRAADGRVLTVTAHALKDAAATRAFYLDQRPKPGKGQPKVTVAAGGRGFVYTDAGSTFGGLRGERVVILASIYGGKGDQAAAMGQVLVRLAGKLAPAVPPRRQR